MPLIHGNHLLRAAQALKLAFLLVLLLSAGAAHAQIDSLRNELAKAPHDSVRMRLCIAIAAQQSNNNLDSAFLYADKAEAFARSINSPKGVADAQYHRTYAVFYGGNIDSALQMYLQLVKDYRALGDSGCVAACFNKAGYLYRDKGDRVKALKQFHLALAANIDNKNKVEAAGSYLNIGIIHHDQQELEQALKYELQALALYEQTSDVARISNALLRIGNVYNDLDQDTTALTYFQRALALGQQIQNDRLVAISLGNMAGVYSKWKQNDRALSLYWQALGMRRKIGDQNGESLLLNSIGEEYLNVEKYDSAFFFFRQSYDLADSIDYPDMIMSNALGFSRVYAAQNNFAEAYKWYNTYHEMYAAINKEENSKEINRLNTMLEAEERTRDLEHMAQQKIIDDAALSQEKTKGWFLGIVLAIVAALAVSIFINNRKTRRTNVVLETQKTEIAGQKKIVEEQHRDIVDSVNYALRIQQAVLPSRNELKRIFPESFIVYKPRDIVSGDFWWIAEKAGVKVVVVADCTGHGVPGAFMSLIGTSLLNEIIMEKSITDPGIALNLLSEKVMKALHQNEDRVSAQDGMDIALAVIDENAGLLMFAGANNSLYYTNIAGELHEVKGDRQPIGFYIDKHLPFNVHTIPLHDVTNIYMLTDGYADQFCGNAGTQFGKKFKYSRLKTALTDVQRLNTLQQKEHLQRTFEEWKAGMFQVDDVLVLGIRLY